MTQPRILHTPVLNLRVLVGEDDLGHSNQSPPNPAPGPQPILKLAHDVLWAGHLGVERTRERALVQFFQAGVYQDTKDYYAS